MRRMIHWFVKGGPVMWPLLLCSIIALGVIIERLTFWLQERSAQDSALVHKLLHLTERGLFEQAAAAAQGSRDGVARILVNGLSHHHFSLEGALEVAVQAELKRMKRYLGVLDTIITVAPLLGIFGTGIAQAVITTIAGLGIAIPTVVAYNYFSARVEDMASQISTHVTNFQILYQQGKTKHAGETVYS